MRTRLTIAAILTTGVAMMGGGALLSRDAGTTFTGTPDTQTEAVLPTAVDGARAERIALDLVGAGTVGDVELDLGDRDDDPYRSDHWEVEVREPQAVHEVDIDARTGSILGHDRRQVPTT